MRSPARTRRERQRKSAPTIRSKPPGTASRPTATRSQVRRCPCPPNPRSIQGLRRHGRLGTDIFFATIRAERGLIAKDSPPTNWRAPSPSASSTGPRYNALALPLPQAGDPAAKEVDPEIKSDRLRGPLQGIPYGAKDLLSVAGQLTTWGAKPYAAQVFDYTATVLDKLDSAGAILTGKLAMVELAGGGGYSLASASLFGPGLNPWDRTRWSGGSSSGSATAVAAGLVTFALGSETSGSIVTPASYCGVTGCVPPMG